MCFARRIPAPVADVSEFHHEKKEHFGDSSRFEVELESDVTNLWLIHFVGLSFPARKWSCRGTFGLWLFVIAVHCIILGLTYVIMTNIDSKGIPGCRQADPEDVVKFDVTLAAESFSIAERMIGARCTAFGNIFDNLPLEIQFPAISPALLPFAELLLLQFFLRKNSFLPPPHLLFPLQGQKPTSRNIRRCVQADSLLRPQIFSRK